MIDGTKLLEDIQKKLRDLKGEDCYQKGVLFRDGDDDREALIWVKETCSKVFERKGSNAKKAGRFLVMLERILRHGYIDHLLMHMGEQAREDNAKLRETVDHLATKLGEKS